MAQTFPQGLEPSYVWQQFALIASVPHGSGNEAQLREKLIAWAKEHNFDYKTDEAGNMVVIVPPTKGMEDRPTTVLQGHIDMVCEKNEEVDFDFEKEGIRVVVEGDHVTAQGTTLGADNGIGVAIAMAVAIDPEVKHGPLELLFTVEEETGMDGAFALKPGFVTGEQMLNLDTEEEGSIYVSCSGGGDVRSSFKVETSDIPEKMLPYQIEVKGLMGGHSGLDIIENRANAIKSLTRVLLALWKDGIDFRLASIKGGSQRNAIPREASCLLYLAEEKFDEATKTIAQMEEILKKEFKKTDKYLQVLLSRWEGASSGKALTEDLTRRLLHALNANPSSTIAMSQEIEGLVETSNNLGVIETNEDEIVIVNCTRSSKEPSLEALRSSLLSLYELAGAEAVLEPSYPGWEPDMDSPLLKTATKVHTELFGEPIIKAVHAGLECGVIGKIYPKMKMISIGPDISGAHSPDEKVSISSTQRFYEYVKALLAQL